MLSVSLVRIRITRSAWSVSSCLEQRQVFVLGRDHPWPVRPRVVGLEANIPTSDVRDGRNRTKC